MLLQRGNLAIAFHAADGKSLLLFRKTRDGLWFLGEMVCEKHHIEKAPDRDGNQRAAIVFELRPLSAIVETMEQALETDRPKTLDELRALAKVAASIVPLAKTAGVRNIYQRSRDVRNYILARAAGNCEGCKAPASFLRKDASPYLESHHIRRVSDGGPDDRLFVIALCPNCHRRVHAGQDGEGYNSSLLAAM
jgi:5-methylcytosine-specific restriction protein A